MKTLNFVKMCALFAGVALFLASCETPETKRREVEKENAQKNQIENPDQGRVPAPIPPPAS